MIREMPGRTGNEGAQKSYKNNNVCIASQSSRCPIGTIRTNLTTYAKWVLPHKCPRGQCTKINSLSDFPSFRFLGDRNTYPPTTHFINGYAAFDITAYNPNSVCNTAKAAGCPDGCAQKSLLRGSRPLHLQYTTKGTFCQVAMPISHRCARRKRKDTRINFSC